jgi:branched-chain amino acid transport system ATP-binding protein
MSLLELTDTVASYGAVRATHGVSFTVAPNEIVALVGANGAGKSSTLKAIMGLVRLTAGRIRLDGEDIGNRRPYEIVRRGVAFSPEGRRVFGASSVRDNLLAGAHTVPRAAIADRMAQILAYFPRLEERIGQLAGTLSGGEQQMLAIGRALMSRPRLLLLDEPSLGLAPVIVQRIGAVITDIQRAEQLAVILAEQNSTWALKLARRGLVLEVGRVQLEGLAEDLRADDHVRRAYLGA